MKTSMPTRLLFALVFSALFLLGLTSRSFAQFETAAVLGTVFDSADAVVPQAHITLLNLDTGTAQEVVSTSDGSYQFLEVRVGKYRVTAEAAGFKKSQTPDFRVGVGARQRVDLKLQVGDLNEMVEVTAAPTMLQSESSDRGQLINTEQVVNLPLNGRSTASLALLTPGVRLAYALSKRESSFNVNGMRSQFNDFILDGVDNNAYGTSNQGLSNQVVQVAPDAVQEFSVVTDNWGAEYGRVGGAVVNASVRSGTNQLHGTVWEFLRNTDLNAVGYFKPVGGQKPVYIQNQYGLAAGGPIRKDKMFFFIDYEGWRRLQKSVSFASVPTLDQRVGNFGAGFKIKNPYTGVIYTNGIIPDADMTTFGSKVFSQMPKPNLSGNTSNYQALLPGTDNANKGDVRYDQYITRKITLFERASYNLYHQLAAPAVDGPSGQGGGIKSRVMNWQTATGVTWITGPKSLLEFRFGASQTEGMKTPATLDGVADMFQLYGIPGLPTAKNLIGGLNTQNITGYQSYGRDYTSPQWQNPFVLNPKVNFSKILGRHTLKLGYEYQAIQTNINDFNPAYGQDIYGGQFSNPGKSNTVYNLVDFLYGARSTYQLTNQAVANLEQRMHFTYLQDDFKFSRKLALNLGISYEFATPQYERDNRQANYDSKTNSLILATNGSIASRTGVNPRYTGFAPRLGFAYSVIPKTVIRSGYGISYVQFERQGGDSYLAYNGPYVVNAQITQSPSQGLCSASSAPTSCFRPTMMGIPDGFVSSTNFSTKTTRTVYIEKDIRTPYIQNWQLSIQRELSKYLMLDLGYVGNHGVGLWVTSDLNQAVPNAAGQSLPVKARRPNSQFDYIDQNLGVGFSNYHALQAKAEIRNFQGLTVLNSFTWSKAIDDAAGALEMGNGDQQSINIFDPASSKGLSGYDQPFNNTASVVWDIPFGNGRHYWANIPYALNAVLGDWSISGINTAASGQTINLTYDPSTAFIATDGSKNSAIYRPNVTGKPMMPKGQRTITQYFNPNTVSVPTDVTQPYGNSGRNTGRSNSYQNLDLGIHKQFPLWREGRFLEFRTEMFNALNKTNFSAANGDRSSSKFGTITTAFPGRQVQFALKVLF
jgi:hypothetical protein